MELLPTERSSVHFQDAFSPERGDANTFVLTVNGTEVLPDDLAEAFSSGVRQKVAFHPLGGHLAGALCCRRRQDNSGA